MKNRVLQEILVAVILIVLLLFFLNPFNFWMPNALIMMMVAGLVVLFAIFASFIWRENARDEREGLHKLVAARFAFLAGAGVLVIGVIIQSLSHTLDPWLVAALGVMILAKIIGLIYSHLKH